MEQKDVRHLNVIKKDPCVLVNPFCLMTYGKKTEKPLEIVPIVIKISKVLAMQTVQP